MYKIWLLISVSMGCIFTNVTPARDKSTVARDEKRALIIKNVLQSCAETSYEHLANLLLTFDVPEMQSKTLRMEKVRLINPWISELRSLWHASGTLAGKHLADQALVKRLQQFRHTLCCLIRDVEEDIWWRECSLEYEALMQKMSERILASRYKVFSMDLNLHEFLVGPELFCTRRGDDAGGLGGVVALHALRKLSPGTDIRTGRYVQLMNRAALQQETTGAIPALVTLALVDAVQASQDPLASYQKALDVLHDAAASWENQRCALLYSALCSSLATQRYALVVRILQSEDPTRTMLNIVVDVMEHIAARDNQSYPELSDRALNFCQQRLSLEWQGEERFGYADVAKAIQQLPTPEYETDFL